MNKKRYRGYTIVETPHPTPRNSTKTAYDIVDGTVVKKANIGSIALSEHYIDLMIKYGYWPEIGGLANG